MIIRKLTLILLIFVLNCCFSHAFGAYKISNENERIYADRYRINDGSYITFETKLVYVYGENLDNDIARIHVDANGSSFSYDAYFVIYRDSIKDSNVIDNTSNLKNLSKGYIDFKMDQEMNVKFVLGTKNADDDLVRIYFSDSIYIIEQEAKIENISFSINSPVVGKTVKTTVRTDINAYRVDIRYSSGGNWFEMDGGDTVWYHNREFNSEGDKTIEVRVVNSNNDIVDTSNKSLTVLPIPITKPVFNSGVSLNSIDGGISTRWNEASGTVDYYELYRSTSNNTLGSRIFKDIGLTYNDTNVTSGVTYYYTAKACNDAGCSTGNQDYMTYSPLTIPVFNSGVSLNSIDGGISTRWNEASGTVDYYELYRSTSSGTLGSRIFKAYGLSYNDTNVTSDVTYYYTAKACNDAGCTSGNQDHMTYSPIAGSTAKVSSISFSDSTPEVGQSIKITVVTTASAYKVQIRYNDGEEQWHDMSGSDTKWFHDVIFKSSGPQTIDVKTLDALNNQVHSDNKELTVLSIPGSDAYIDSISFSESQQEIEQNLTTTVITRANAHKVEICYESDIWHSMNGSETIWEHIYIYHSPGEKLIKVKTINAEGTQIDLSSITLEILPKNDELPTIQITNTPLTEITDDVLSVGVHATDDNGLRNISYKIFTKGNTSGIPVLHQSNSVSGLSLSYTWDIDISSLDENEYQAIFFVTDDCECDHVVEINHIFTRIPRQVPQITSISTNPSVPTEGESITFTVNTNISADIVNLQFDEDNEMKDMSSSNENTRWRYIKPLGLNPGTHSYTIFIIDADVSYAYNREIFVDFMKPEIVSKNFGTPSGDMLVSEYVNFTVITDLPCSKVTIQYSIDGIVDVMTASDNKTKWKISRLFENTGKKSITIRAYNDNNKETDIDHISFRIPSFQIKTDVFIDDGWGIDHQSYITRKKRKDIVFIVAQIENRNNEDYQANLQLSYPEDWEFVNHHPRMKRQTMHSVEEEIEQTINISTPGNISILDIPLLKDQPDTSQINEGFIQYIFKLITSDDNEQLNQEKQITLKISPSNQNSFKDSEDSCSVMIVDSGDIIITNRHLLYQRHIEGATDVNKEQILQTVDEMLRELFIIAYNKQSLVFYVDRWDQYDDFTEYLEQDRDGIDEDNILINSQTGIDDPSEITLTKNEYKNPIKWWGWKPSTQVWDRNVDIDYSSEKGANRIAILIDKYIHSWAESLGGINRGRKLLIVGGDDIIPFYRMKGIPSDWLNGINDNGFHRLNYYDASRYTKEAARNDFAYSDIIYADSDNEDYTDAQVENIYPGRIIGQDYKVLLNSLKRVTQPRNQHDNVIIAAHFNPDPESDESRFPSSAKELTEISNPSNCTMNSLCANYKVNEENQASLYETVINFNMVQNEFIHPFDHFIWRGHGSNSTTSRFNSLDFDKSITINSQSKPISQLFASYKSNFTMIACLNGLVDRDNVSSVNNRLMIYSLTRNNARDILAATTISNGSKNNTFVNDYYRSIVGCPLDGEPSNIVWKSSKTLGESLKEARLQSVSSNEMEGSSKYYRACAPIYVLYGSPWNKYSPPTKTRQPLLVRNLNSQNSIIFKYYKTKIKSTQYNTFTKEICETIENYTINKISTFDFISINEYKQRELDEQVPVLPAKRFSFKFSKNTKINSIQVIPSKSVNIGNLNIPGCSVIELIENSSSRYIDLPDSVGLYDTVYDYNIYNINSHKVLWIDLIPIIYNAETDEAILHKQMCININYETPSNGVLTSEIDKSQFTFGEKVPCVVGLENITDQHQTYNALVTIQDEYNNSFSEKTILFSVEPVSIVQKLVELDLPKKGGSYNIKISASDEEHILIGKMEHLINVIPGYLVDIDIQDNSFGNEFHVIYKNISEEPYDVLFGLSIFDGTTEQIEFLQKSHTVLPQTEESVIFDLQYSSDLIHDYYTAQATAEINEYMTTKRKRFLLNNHIMFNTYNDKTLDLQIKNGMYANIQSIDPASIESNQGKPQNIPYGLINMNITTDIGEKVIITVNYPDTLNKTSWVQYDETNHWVTYPNTVTNSSENSIEITLYDGGDGDIDQIENGIIKTVSGLFYNEESPPSPPSPDSGGGGGCFIEALIY